jgi:D-aspartate ligase
VLTQLRWTGFCDFDFVVDPRGDVPRLMEINPRFPECMHMGTSVGIDFPAMIFDMAMGNSVTPVLDYPKDRFLRFMVGDLLWFLRVDNRRRFSTWPSWFKFFDGKTAYQIERIGDLGPLMGYLLENLHIFFTDRRLRQDRLRLTGGKSAATN